VATDCVKRLRCSRGQAALWLLAAGGERNFSRWARGVLDAAAADLPVAVLSESGRVDAEFRDVGSRPTHVSSRRAPDSLSLASLGERDDLPRVPVEERAKPVVAPPPVHRASRQPSSGLCPHRVPSSAYCKRCEEEE
jgi:hypothetical protein